MSFRTRHILAPLPVTRFSILQLFVFRFLSIIHLSRNIYIKQIELYIEKRLITNYVTFILKRHYTIVTC